MRVLVFMTQFYQQSGAERLAVELAESLNARSIHTDILSLYRSDLEGVKEARADLEQRGIPEVHFLNMDVHPKPHTLPSAVRRLRTLIRAGAYDVVETSMITPSIIAAWACRGLPVRHVAGIHDIFTRDRYNSAKCKLWRFTMRVNKKTRFYAISNHAAENWVRYSGTSRNRTRTVLNSIPDACFGAEADRDGLREEFALPSSSRIVLFVGRLLKRKGIDTLYAALAPVLAEQDLYLFYVGPEDMPEHFFGDEAGLLEALKDDIRKDGLEDRVRFLGKRSDVPRLMASADLLAHPARIEGFGLVLAEALAAGLPVVASNVDGIPEVLEDTGSLLIPPDDPAACRDAVLAALNWTEHERATVVTSGRERANAFRTERRVDELAAMFSGNDRVG